MTKMANEPFLQNGFQRTLASGMTELPVFHADKNNAKQGDYDVHTGSSCRPPDDGTQ
jgi:hypothetical protein